MSIPNFHCFLMTAGSGIQDWKPHLCQGSILPYDTTFKETILHEHDLLVFHWCSQSFPYIFVDNDDMAAAVDNACDHNCVIQSNLNHLKWQCWFGQKMFVVLVHGESGNMMGCFGMCLCWKTQ